MNETDTATRAVEGRIEIDAPVDAVWRALVEADELERWFPLEARVDPGVGGQVWMSWKNEYEGASEILEWEPNRRLRITWGGWDGEGPPMVTDFHLEGKGGGTVLRVVTSGFPTDASWDAWVEGTRSGWRYELRSLKRYLERHAGTDREVVYLRRRVKASADEAWARLTGPDGVGERPLDGEPFDVDPPRQYAAEVEDPPGLVRVSTEPCMGRDDVRDATLFLSAWGADPARVEAVRAEWETVLDRVFPDAETP